MQENMQEKWLTTDDQSYTLGVLPKEVDTLPPNYYSLGFNHDTQRVIFIAIKDVSDDIYRFKSQGMVEEAVKEIQSFWKKKDFFTKHSFPFRRGILLHGPQGTGKSCAIKMICEDIKKMGGIALDLKDMNILPLAMKEIRSIHPDMPVVAIVEDIDQQLRHNEVSVTNMMDGLGGFDNIVFLGTTNYIERISERVRNRPSRFDRRFFIGYPSLETRVEYFTNLAKKSKIGENRVNEFAEVSEGLSFAHMKELFIAVIGFETPVEEAVKRLKDMGNINEDDHRGPKKLTGFLDKNLVGSKEVPPMEENTMCEVGYAAEGGA